MLRLAFASLTLLASLAACSTSARAPVSPPANAVSTTRYELMPLSIEGREGRHSSVHSSTRMTGALSITGDRAELVLERDTLVSFVHCPDDMVSGRVYTRQQCAPHEAKPYHRKSRRILRGTARTENGVLVVSVTGEQPSDRRFEPSTLAMTCNESFLGYTCSIDAPSMFPLQVPPRTLTLLTPGTKRFTITPVDVNEVGRVTGTLTLDVGTIALTLALDGGTPTTLLGTATWRDEGPMLHAQTSPTRNFGALCAVEGDGLRCRITGDRSIFGTSVHINTRTLFVPARDAVPAPSPMFGRPRASSSDA